MKRRRHMMMRMEGVNSHGSLSVCSRYSSCAGIGNSVNVTTKKTRQVSSYSDLHIFKKPRSRIETLNFLYFIRETDAFYIPQPYFTKEMSRSLSE